MCPRPHRSANLYPENRCALVQVQLHGSVEQGAETRPGVVGRGAAVGRLHTALSQTTPRTRARSGFRIEWFSFSFPSFLGEHDPEQWECHFVPANLTDRFLGLPMERFPARRVRSIEMGCQSPREFYQRRPAFSSSSFRCVLAPCRQEDPFPVS